MVGRERQPEGTVTLRGLLSLAVAGAGIGGGATLAFFHRGDSLDEIRGLVEVLGTPVGIAAVLAFSIWRVAKWIAPRVDKLLDRHIVFIDSAQKCAEENSECLRDIRNSQRAVERSQKAIEASVAEQSHVAKATQVAIQQLACKTN